MLFRNGGTDYSFRFSRVGWFGSFGFRPVFCGWRMRPRRVSRWWTKPSSPQGRPVWVLRRRAWVSAGTSSARKDAQSGIRVCPDVQAVLEGVLPQARLVLVPVASVPEHVAPPVARSTALRADASLRHMMGKPRRHHPCQSRHERRVYPPPGRPQQNSEPGGLPPRHLNE